MWFIGAIFGFCAALLLTTGDVDYRDVVRHGCGHYDGQTGTFAWGGLKP